MSRSNSKGLFVEKSLWKKVIANNQNLKKKEIKTWSRKSTIYPEFVGNTFLVHNGKIFVKVYCTEEMVGRKLGEFAPTRTFKMHSSNRKAEDAAAEAKVEAKKAGA